MTTAYSGAVGDGTLGLSSLSYIPFAATLKSGQTVQVGPFRPHVDWRRGMDLMNDVIRKGQSWPFAEEFQTMDSYRSYFLSHTALCVRAVQSGGDDGDDDDDTTSSNAADDFMGGFYIKPNFPGRCSHICNGGFLTAPRFRSQGVGRLMGQAFLQVAKDLGYKSAYFNLVFQSNQASVALWESLGFERVAVLEKAVDLKGIDGLDTAYGYRFDLETLADDYLTQARRL
jgi:GNAT superfamily N-acetyltransferase